MRIAVADATGRIGQLTVDALEGAGHEAVPVSRKARCCCLVPTRG